MIATVDYVGLATLISALGATITGLLVAVRTTAIKKTSDATHDAVKTSNGQTIGELVEAGEVRRVDADPSTTKHS